jgi:hypothetical protein
MEDIKIKFRNINGEVVFWTKLTQDRIPWLYFVNTIMNILIL